MWFRDSCQREAARLGVVGWVRNREDGRVEAVYEGERSVVEAIVAWSRIGPARAVVQGIEIIDEAPLGQTGFDIVD